jgi:FkbM family methyltransferase
MASVQTVKRSLAADTPFGRAIRLPLRVIRPGTVVPILATRARGKRWIAGSGPHSCWLGFNEYQKRRRFSRVVQPGNVVWDVGANVGSWTILAAQLVGESGHVVAVEPLPDNLRFLREHIRINQLRNVHVLQNAVYDRCGTVHFAPAPDRLMGCVTNDGPLAVTALTLDCLLDQPATPAPHCIKIDIEGGEAAALAGGSRLLHECRPIIFLATHGDEVHAACVTLLNAAGYRIEQIGRDPAELIAWPSPRLEY